MQRTHVTPYGAAWLIAAALAVGLVAGAVGLADDRSDETTSGRRLASGLKVGEKVPTFYVRAVTGPLKSRSVCYVCRNGDRPVVMLFIRQITPDVRQLLKAIDGEVDQRRASGLRSFGVFLPEEGKELLPQVQTLAFDEKLGLPLTIAAAPSDGTAAGGIHRDAAVTVILYREVTVRANFAYRAGELNQPAIEEIIGSVRRLADEELSAPATR